MRTRLCDELGIDVPIFAFSHCRDVVAAVSNAGGLGVLGALAFSPEQLEIELAWIDEHTGTKPYGVDTVMPMGHVGKETGLGKKGGEEDAIEFKKLIPPEVTAWIETVLEEYEVPPLPEGYQRDEGTGVLMVSQDLDELLSLADRILVMNEGRIVGEFNAREATRTEIGEAMMGTAAEAPS